MDTQERPAEAYTTDVGDLSARFGGGGHRGSGSIQLEPETADGLIDVLIRELRS